MVSTDFEINFNKSQIDLLFQFTCTTNIVNMEMTSYKQFMTLDINNGMSANDSMPKLFKMMRYLFFQFKLKCEMSVTVIQS